GASRALLVRQAEITAPLAIAGDAGPIEEDGGSRHIAFRAGAGRVDNRGVEAAEGVAALAAELGQLAPFYEILLQAFAREIQRSQERTGPRGVTLGVHILAVRLSVTRFLEDRRRARLVLRDSDSVAIGAPDVHASVQVGVLTSRPVAASAVEREGPRG